MNFLVMVVMRDGTRFVTWPKWMFLSQQKFVNGSIIHGSVSQPPTPRPDLYVDRSSIQTGIMLGFKWEIVPQGISDVVGVCPSRSTFRSLATVDWH